jgi:hypothetical protein
MSFRHLLQRRPSIAGAALTIGLALASSFAHATIISGTSTLSEANSGLGGGTGDFGALSISLNNSTGAATFTFTGANGYEFIDSNVADLNLSSTIFTFSAGALTPGGVTLTSTGSNTVDGFGTFTETTSIGNASQPQGSISFTLTSSAFIGLTSISQLLLNNGNGFDAAAHMCDFASGGCAAGLTGFVAETGVSSGVGGGSVPEPSTLSIFGAALLAGLGYRFVRRSTPQVLAATA